MNSQLWNKWKTFFRQKFLLLGWWDGSVGKSTRLLFRRSSSNPSKKRVQIPATTWWLTTIRNKIWLPLLECLKTATVYLHIINKLIKKKKFFLLSITSKWDCLVYAFPSLFSFLSLSFFLSFFPFLSFSFFPFLSIFFFLSFFLPSLPFPSLFSFLLFFSLVFPDRNSWLSWTHCVDQAGFELRDQPASASWELGLKVFATTAQSGVWFFCFVLFCFVCLFFRDRISLCSPGCPGTHSVDQAGLELRNPPASASQVLGLKACTATARLIIYLSMLGLWWTYEVSMLPSHWCSCIWLSELLLHCLGWCSRSSCPQLSSAGVIRMCLHTIFD